MKCALLPIEEAKTQPCWDATLCHRRRSHYRHRQQNNQQRRQERRLNRKAIPAAAPTLNSEQVIEIALPAPETLAAFLMFVRRSPSAPVHAIGAEVWQQGRLVGRIPLQHTLGMRGPELHEYLQQMQQKLRSAFGIERFEDTFIEIPPEACPLPDCPLHPRLATGSTKLGLGNIMQEGGIT